MADRVVVVKTIQRVAVKTPGPAGGFILNIDGGRPDETPAYVGMIDGGTP